jgi:hypothetical protein
MTRDHLHDLFIVVLSFLLVRRIGACGHQPERLLISEPYQPSEPEGGQGEIDNLMHRHPIFPVGCNAKPPVVILHAQNVRTHRQGEDSRQQAMR